MRPPIRAARAVRQIALRQTQTPIRARTLFSWLRGSSEAATSSITPLSSSPHPALVQKADRIKAASLCPTSYEKHGGERVRPAFDCPDCGWPTHKNKERWEEGLAEHKEYCERLREVNMDEHDIRSGRKMKEFEDMPGMCFGLNIQQRVA
jgi:splicing suppressor protein 51